MEDTRIQNEQQMMQELSTFFISGDIAGAMKYMQNIPEMKDVLNLYIDIFENENYIDYPIPENLNQNLKNLIEENNNHNNLYSEISFLEGKNLRNLNPELNPAAGF